MSYVYKQVKKYIIFACIGNNNNKKTAVEFYIPPGEKNHLLFSKLYSGLHISHFKSARKTMILSEKMSSTQCFVYKKKISILFSEDKFKSMDKNKLYISQLQIFSLEGYVYLCIFLFKNLKYLYIMEYFITLKAFYLCMANDIGVLIRGFSVYRKYSWI